MPSTWGDETVEADRLPTEVVPDLEWVQANVGHELRGAGSVFARLRFTSRFRHCKVALAETVDHRWEIRRKGWIDHTVVVREQGGDYVVAEMPLGGEWAGTLVRPEGRRMISTLRWSSRSETWDTEDDWVIRYHNSSGFRSFQARVEVHAGIAHLSELPLLITLGWFVKVLGYRLHRKWFMVRP